MPTLDKIINLKMNKKKIFYETVLGQLFLGDSYNELTTGALDEYKGNVNLIISSPPFPLNNKKKYGNLKGESYKEWFIGLAPRFEALLAENGSLVIEIGNAWESERPVQSLLHLECLLVFVQNRAKERRVGKEGVDRCS